VARITVDLMSEKSSRNYISKPELQPDFALESWQFVLKQGSCSSLSYSSYSFDSLQLLCRRRKNVRTDIGTYFEGLMTVAVIAGKIGYLKYASIRTTPSALIS
jgi:hypothetical protein